MNRTVTESTLYLYKALVIFFPVERTAKVQICRLDVLANGY